MSDSTPFHDLSPDTVLDALQSAGQWPDGRLLALNSYENRVYQVWLDAEAPLVVKFYRPGRWSDAAILEEHRWVQHLHDADLPVVPPMPLAGATLHFFQGHRWAAFPRQGGRAPELDAPGVLERMGLLMGRMHAASGPGAFEHRPRLDPDTFGRAACTFLLDGDWIPQELLPAWKSIVELCLDEVRHCFDRAGDIAWIRTHGDCHPGNVLWTDAGPHFVDFDDARTAPAVQDLWMLLSGDRASMTQQLGQVIDGYEQFAPFDPRQLHLIEALRTLRLLHYSAWIAQRWQDPAFPRAFPWFNTPRYWQDRILELKEQLSLMQEPVLIV